MCEWNEEGAILSHQWEIFQRIVIWFIHHGTVTTSIHTNTIWIGTIV